MDIKTLYFKNRRLWRNWLEQHHANKEGAWLIYYKKNSDKTGLSYNDALEEALCFGWIDGKMQSVDEEKFILRYSPRKARSIWSKLNKEKAGLLIEQGRMTDAGLAKIEEARKNGLREEAYTSGAKETIPSDLEIALSENKIAWNTFHNLASSYRNMFIRWLNNAKTEKMRKKRIIQIVKRAQLNKKVRYGSL